MIHNSMIIQKCLQMEYQIKTSVETSKSKKTVRISGGLCQIDWVRKVGFAVWNPWEVKIIHLLAMDELG